MFLYFSPYQKLMYLCEIYILQCLVVRRLAWERNPIKFMGTHLHAKRPEDWKSETSLPLQHSGIVQTWGRSVTRCQIEFGAPLVHPGHTDSGLLGWLPWGGAERKLASALTSPRMPSASASWYVWSGEQGWPSRRPRSFPATHDRQKSGTARR